MNIDKAQTLSDFCFEEKNLKKNVKYLLQHQKKKKNDVAYICLFFLFNVSAAFHVYKNCFVDNFLFIINKIEKKNFYETFPIFPH